MWSIRPSYQSFRSAFQHGVAAAAGDACTTAANRAAATIVTRTSSFSGGTRSPSVRRRCKAFVSDPGTSPGDGSFAPDAGDPGTAARRAARPRRPRESSSAAAPETARSCGSAAAPCSIMLALLAAQGAPGGCLRAAAARRARRLARALDLVVVAARPLVGLRRPGARLPPLRGARAVARPANARARERRSASCSARSSSGRSRGRCCRSCTTTGRPALTRLSAPVGLWNQLAVLGAFALPLALWRRRLAGTLLAYGWIVALLLTYSRGGILTALVVVAAWLALTDERIESAATLVAAAVPAGVVVGGRVRPARRDERRPVRRTCAGATGSIFGVLLLAGAAAAVALERLPRARRHAGAAPRPARRRAAARRGCRRLFVVVKGGRVGRGRERRRAARLDQLELPLRLVAPGLGRLPRSRARWARARARSTSRTCASARAILDFTIEPHNLPLAVPLRGGSRRARRCSCSLRRCSCAAASGGAGTSWRWRSSCPRTSCTRSSTSTGTSSRSRRSCSSSRARSSGSPPVRPVSLVRDARGGRRGAARVRRAAPAVARRALVGAGGGRARRRSTRSRWPSARARSIRCSSSRC